MQDRPHHDIFGRHAGRRGKDIDKRLGDVLRAQGIALFTPLVERATDVVPDSVLTPPGSITDPGVRSPPALPSLASHGLRACRHSRALVRAFSADQQGSTFFNGTVR